MKAKMYLSVILGSLLMVIPCFADPFASTVWNKCGVLKKTLEYVPPKVIRITLGETGTTSNVDLDLGFHMQIDRVNREAQHFIIGYMSALHDSKNAELYNPNSNYEDLFERSKKFCIEHADVSFADSIRHEIGIR